MNHSSTKQVSYVVDCSNLQLWMLPDLEANHEKPSQHDE